MKIITNNKLIRGIVHKGIKYTGGSQDLTIKNVFSTTIGVKIYPSAGSQQTTGYTIGFTATDAQFKLYKPGDLATPLDYLPEHKFILKNVIDEVRPEWILVYDGECLFHIEGGTNAVLAHVSTKISQQEITLCLTDENDDIFLADIPSVLKGIVNTASTSVSYVSSTLTSEQSRVEVATEDKITLPHNVVDTSSYGNTYYLISSVSSDTAITLPLEKSILL